MRLSAAPPLTDLGMVVDHLRRQGGAVAWDGVAAWLTVHVGVPAVLCLRWRQGALELELPLPVVLEAGREATAYTTANAINLGLACPGFVVTPRLVWRTRLLLADAIAPRALDLAIDGALAACAAHLPALRAAMSTRPPRPAPADAGEDT